MRIAVTGAFGYSGRYIAKRLLEAGHQVITLTNSLNRLNPFGKEVTPFPFHFGQPDQLRDSLRGVEVLINTYWVRFDHRLFTHGQAVANTRILFSAAKEAGELVIQVGRAIGVKRPIISVSPEVGYWSCRFLGLFVGDVVITREEIRGLMEGRLCVDAPRLGATKLTQWMEAHKDTLGRRYTSEMARRVDRASQYRSN